MRKKSEFLTMVSDQIRWKRAHCPLLNELEGHIIERQEALIADGCPEDEAELQAVAEMGDPEDIGLALDRIHRPRPNWALIGCVAALLATGILLLWSVGDRETYMAPMLIYTAIGAAALVGGYFLDYTALAKCPRWVLFAASALCVVFQILGNAFYSSATQLCYILPVLFIPLVYRTRSGQKSDIIIMILGAAACFCADIFSMSWLGLCVYMVAVCGGMILYAAKNGWFGAMKRLVLCCIFVPPTVLFALLCAMSFGRLKFRLWYGVFRPQLAPDSYGWLPLRVRELLSSARLFGEGEYSELLNMFIDTNEICSVDHLLAVAAYKHGLIVLLLVAALTVAIGIIIVRGIKHQSSRLGALTMLTIGLCFGLRALVYFVNNLGLPFLYLDGLPLFSYCGKLLVPDMLMAGMLLSIFRTESIARDISLPSRNDVSAA